MSHVTPAMIEAAYNEQFNDSYLDKGLSHDQLRRILQAAMNVAYDLNTFRNAERYLWLRDRARMFEFQAPLVFMADDYGNAMNCLDATELDEAVDAAMKTDEENML